MHKYHLNGLNTSDKFKFHSLHLEFEGLGIESKVKHMAATTNT